MTDTNAKQRGNRPLSIANQQLSGAMEADDARDDRLFFRFMRNLSDNSEIAARKELGQDSPTANGEPPATWPANSEEVSKLFACWPEPGPDLLPGES